MAKILVVEDETALRLLVSRALCLDGHDVEVAEDGGFALDMLMAAEGGFDLVLSDIRMPAVTGIELAHEIAAAWPGLPVLLMTGYAEQREAAEDLQAIIEGVIEKPFAIADIRREVAQRLAASTRPAVAKADDVLERRCA